jgi:voltage-gated potassium channel
LYRQFDPDAWQGAGLSPLNKIVLTIVITSVFTAVLESEPLIKNAAPAFFTAMTAIFAVCFTVEYALRSLPCLQE